MKRREFLKSLAATGCMVAASGATGTLIKEAQAAKKTKMGEIKSLKVDVLSETSWFDNAQMVKNISDYGGANTNQYDIPWNWDNAGGYSALLTITQLDGTEKKILLDSGWNTEWMDYIWEMNNIPEMLKSGEIEFMILSHWHLDHYWGIESTLKHKPDITIYAPETHFPEDMKLLKGGKLTAKNKEGEDVLLCKNDTPHSGKLILCNPDGEDGSGQYSLMPGVAMRMFDVPILLRTRGENILYFNVKDKGIVSVTGCAHPGILSILSWARQNIDNYKPYGCYGGLHISVFENWEPRFDDLIKGFKGFGLSKVGCNHCTGWVWAEKAAASGIPIIKGTNKFQSYKKQSAAAGASNVFLANGDTVVF